MEDDPDDGLNTGDEPRMRINWGRDLKPPAQRVAAAAAAAYDTDAMDVSEPPAKLQRRVERDVPPLSQPQPQPLDPPAAAAAANAAMEDDDTPRPIFDDHDYELFLCNGMLDIALYELDQYQMVFEEEKRRFDSSTTGVSQMEYIASLKEATKRATMGDYRLNKFKQYMASFKLVRYAPQMSVVSYAISGLIPLMFGAAFEHHKARIIREHGLSDFRTQVYVSFPRRRGKTQIMSAIEAAAQAVMGGKTALFAAVFQQASDLMDLIHGKLLEILPKEWIRHKNSRRMVVCQPGANEADANAHVGVVRCYSSSVTSARGFTACRIYFDEASFAKAEFFLKNVFAGMLLKDTFVLMVSSPGRDHTPFAKLCKAVDPQGFLEHKVLVLDNMCAKCRSNRFATECPHTTMPDPPWFVTREEQEKIRRIMSKISFEAFRAEFLGISESEAMKVFSEESLRAFTTRPPVAFDQPPSYVIIGLDPSGNGRSESAVCALTRDAHGNVVILGVDAFQHDGSGSHEITHTITFCERIMKSKAVRGYSTLLFFAESNYGGSSRAADAYRAVMEWGRRSSVTVRGILAHDSQGTLPGFWLDHNKKERMAMEMAHYLENNKLAMAEGFVAPVLGPAEAKDKLIRQLGDYEKRFKESVSRNGDAREESLRPYTYSGKTSSESDDVVIITQEALLLAVYMQGNHLRLTTPMDRFDAPILDPKFCADGSIKDAFMMRVEAAQAHHSKHAYLFDRSALSRHDIANSVDHDTGEQIERAEKDGAWMTFEEDVGY